MPYRFNKKEKLKSKKLIEKIFREGKNVAHFPLKLYYVRVDEPQEVKIKTAVSVPKKNFKKAVQRNRIKRLLRESYRLNKHLIFNNIEGNFAFLILYLGKGLPEYHELEKAIRVIFQKFENDIK